MPTPSGVTVTASKPDGATEDITEGVQTLYDLLIGSMDWGSGFLTIEDVMPVARIAHFCGFKGHEEVDRYIASEQLEADVQKAYAEACAAKGVNIYGLTVEERTEIRERLKATGYPKW